MVRLSKVSIFWQGGWKQYLKMTTAWLRASVDFKIEGFGLIVIDDRQAVKIKSQHALTSKVAGNIVKLVGGGYNKKYKYWINSHKTS